MGELEFGYIVKRFKRCGRDALSVLNWLIRPIGEGGKGLPESIALQVMLEFAEQIEGGKKFGFTSAGLSELSLAVFAEVERRNRTVMAEESAKILQFLAEKPWANEELGEEIIELLAMIFERVDEGRARERQKKHKKATSIWRKPLGRVWKENVRGNWDE